LSAALDVRSAIGICDANALSAQTRRSFGRGCSRCGAKTGVRIDDPTSAFCVFPAVEAFAEERSAVVLLVQGAPGVQHDAEPKRRPA
jgi:hypothetical protein